MIEPIKYLDQIDPTKEETTTNKVPVYNLNDLSKHLDLYVMTPEGKTLSKVLTFTTGIAWENGMKELTLVDRIEKDKPVWSLYPHPSSEGIMILASFWIKELFQGFFSYQKTGIVSSIYFVIS